MSSYNPKNSVSGRRTRVGETSAQQSGTASPTIHQMRFEVKIMKPIASNRFMISAGRYPEPAPAMPSIPLLAKVYLNGLELEFMDIHWHVVIKGNYRVRSGGTYRLQSYAMAAGESVTMSGEETSFQLVPSQIVGGMLYIVAAFEDDSGVRASASVECMLDGENPNRQDVEAMIRAEAGSDAWAPLRIFCHESNHTLHQFRDGKVLYGPPSGVGIVQRDPTADEWVWPGQPMEAPNNFFPRIFWNWQQNVHEGISTFRSVYLARADREIANLQGHAQRSGFALPTPPDGVRYRAAIRHYNGGTEYEWAHAGNRAFFRVAPRTPPERQSYVTLVLSDNHGAYPAVPAEALAQAWPVLAATQEAGHSDGSPLRDIHAGSAHSPGRTRHRH